MNSKVRLIKPDPFWKWNERERKEYTKERKRATEEAALAYRGIFSKHGFDLTRIEDEIDAIARTVEYLTKRLTEKSTILAVHRAKQEKEREQCTMPDAKS